MTTDLDRTLRQAADSLLDSVATSASMPTPRPRRAPVLAATAVLAVVAVAAAAVAWWPADEGDGEGDRDADVAAEGPVELPHLIADWLPAGYQLTWASDDIGQELQQPPEDPGEDVELSTWHEVVYGDAGADDPFARSDLAVTTWGARDDYSITSRADLVGAVTATIRGQAGVICPPGVCTAQPATMTGVKWVEQGLNIELSSRSLDADQLLSLAEGLTIEGDSVVLGSLPEGLPGPLDELARSDDSPPPETQGTFVSYEPSGSTTGQLSVQTYAAAVDIDLDDPLRIWSYDSTRRVEVRGHDGRIMLREGPSDCQTSCSPLLTTLSWEEAPGVVVRLDATGNDLTESDVLAVAERLRPATPEEWEAALHLGESVDESEVASYIPADAVVSVTTSGLGGAAYLAADGRVCAFMVDGQGKLPDTCGDPGDRVHELRNRLGQVEFVFGLMPAGAHDVAATRTGIPEPMFAFHDVLPEEGPTLYVLTLGIFVPEKLTFRDGQAQPVETVDLDLD